MKLKRHSSSYETDQGEEPQKIFIDRCQNVGLPVSTGRRASTGVWCNW